MYGTTNFGFLVSHGGQLLQLAVWAERYFRDDPGTRIFKLRQFAELLSKTIAANHAVYRSGPAWSIKRRKRAAKLGDFTALTLPTEGGVFHRKVAGGSEPWNPPGPPTEACWLMLTRGGKNPSGPNRQ